MIVPQFAYSILNVNCWSRCAASIPLVLKANLSLQKAALDKSFFERRMATNVLRSVFGQDWKILSDLTINIPFSPDVRAYINYVLKSGEILGISFALDLSFVVPRLVGIADAITFSPNNDVNILTFETNSVNTLTPRASESDGLAILAFATLKEYSWLTYARSTLLHIVQPGANNFSVYKVEFEELNERVYKLERSFKRSIACYYTGRLVFTPGITQCSYCRGQTICHAFKEFSMR